MTLALLPLPDQETLVRLFDYDPETGVLTWRVRPAVNSRLHPGDLAGTLHHSGYIQVGVDGVIYLAHRLIWKRQTGCDPDPEVDHRNRVRNDNRWANLREATVSEQLVNRLTGNYHRGVHLIAKSGKFGAQIKVDRHHIWLGVHDTPEAACRVYRVTSALLHGEFAPPGGCSCH